MDRNNVKTIDMTPEQKARYGLIKLTPMDFDILGMGKGTENGVIRYYDKSGGRWKRWEVMRGEEQLRKTHSAPVKRKKEERGMTK